MGAHNVESKISQWKKSIAADLKVEDLATPAEAGRILRDAADDTNPAQQIEHVYLLRVGGNNVEGLRQRLLIGPELAPCREALAAHGRSCELPEKALVFVKPWQYDAVRRSLVGVEVHYFHIIISESYEYLVEEALQNFPRRQRAKVKHQHRRALTREPFEAEERAVSLMPEPLEVEHRFASFEDMSIVEARSFLCIAPTLMPANQVTQSTTEAVSDSASLYAHSRGVNPRRVLASGSKSLSSLD